AQTREADRARQVRPEPAAGVLAGQDFQTTDRGDLRRGGESPASQGLTVVSPAMEAGVSLLLARAGVAHLVERDLAKVEVAGSKPVSRSNSTSLTLGLVVAGDGTTLDWSGAYGAGCAPASLSLRSSWLSRETGRHLIAPTQPR